MALSLLGSAAATGVRADDVRTTAVSINPDAGVQSSLANIASMPDEPSFDEAVRRLVAPYRRDPRVLVEQILVFAAGDVARHPIVGRIIKALDAPKESVVRALVPQLDNTDARIGADARRMLAGFEDRSVTRPPDFSAYRAMIEDDVRAGRPPQASLVAFMYETDAGTALQTMVRAMQLRDPAEIKPILLAEHVVADLFWKRRFGFIEPKAVEAAALSELEKLSRHERWWARLDVARVVRDNPELGNAAIIGRLAADSNPLVRSTIGGSKVPQPAGK